MHRCEYCGREWTCEVACGEVGTSLPCDGCTDTRAATEVAAQGRITRLFHRWDVEDLGPLAERNPEPPPPNPFRNAFRREVVRDPADLPPNPPVEQIRCGYCNILTERGARRCNDCGAWPEARFFLCMAGCGTVIRTHMRQQFCPPCGRTRTLRGARPGLAPGFQVEVNAQGEPLPNPNEGCMPCKGACCR